MCDHEACLSQGRHSLLKNLFNWSLSIQRSFTFPALFYLFTASFNCKACIVMMIIERMLMISEFLMGRGRSWTTFLNILCQLGAGIAYSVW
jgi:hypothetical protein